jgi:hypothetical protein
MTFLDHIRRRWWAFRVKRHIAKSKRNPGRAYRAWLERRTML